MATKQTAVLGIYRDYASVEKAVDVSKEAGFYSSTLHPPGGPPPPLPLPPFPPLPPPPLLSSSSTPPPLSPPPPQPPPPPPPPTPLPLPTLSSRRRPMKPVWIWG